MKRLKSTLKISWVVLFIASLVTGCTRKTSETPTVNLAIWGNYLSKQSEQRFTEKTGIRLNVMNFSSNEELLAKIQSRGSGIDVAVPSDYMVDVMTKLQLLEPLQKDKIPASRNLNPEVLKQSFDPENRYSLPFTWVFIGIAVNKELYKDPIKSWRDFLENPKLSGKISLLDDVREVTGAVLKMNGKSVNTVDPKDLQQAKETLLKLKKSVKLFTSDTVDILKNKEVIAAQTYSADALQAAAKTQGMIEFIIPSEGCTWAIDNLVLIKGSKHVDEAHRLIDFLLQKETDAEFVTNMRSGPVVLGLNPLLPPDIRQNPILFPAPHFLSKFEHVQDQGDNNRLYEDIWTAVKSAD